jgi:hypothetical protein
VDSGVSKGFKNNLLVHQFHFDAPEFGHMLRILWTKSNLYEICDIFTIYKNRRGSFLNPNLNYSFSFLSGTLASALNISVQSEVLDFCR